MVIDLFLCFELVVMCVVVLVKVRNVELIVLNVFDDD